MWFNLYLVSADPIITTSWYFIGYIMGLFINIIFVANSVINLPLLTKGVLYLELEFLLVHLLLMGSSDQFVELNLILIGFNLLLHSRYSHAFS